MYHRIGVKGHVIHFEHTGKDEVAKILPRSQLDGVLSVAYVGTKQDWNEKITTAQKRQAFLRRYPQTSINVEKVYRFLLLKKALDPAYRDIQIDVRNFDLFRSVETLNSCLQQETELTRQLLERLPELILINALVADSDDSAKLEDETTSNVARPEEASVSEPTTFATTDTIETVQFGEKSVS